MRTILAALAALYLFISAPSHGAALKPPVIQPDRSVRLELTNAASTTTYTLQASTNLNSWFTVGSGSGLNGILVLQHPGASNYSSLFYRSVESTPPAMVTPRLDTNAIALTLVLTNGSQSQLYTTNGLHIQLTVPPTPLPAPLRISMTLVTNLSGLPFSRGIIAAVYVEPPDAQLWGAARLEITLPPGIDRRELVAYRFETNGTRFGGVPSQILTNRILIPITELGGYGVSLATAQEAEAFFAQPVVQPLAGFALPSVAMTVPPDECDPVKKQFADTIRRQISAAMDARRHETGRRLAVARRQQVAGMQSDSAQVIADALQGSCQLYNEMIAPLWPAAQQNCALAKVLSEFTIGIERQRELLGVPDNQSCTSLSTIADCAYYRNCVQEIRDCCLRGSKRSERITTAQGYIRQSQLLGLDCISDQLFQQVVDSCSSNVWNGTFSAVLEVHASSTTTTPFPTGSSTSTRTETGSVHFHGQVEEAREFDFGGGNKSVELVVIGSYNARDYSLDTFYRSASCPSGGGSETVYSIQESENVASERSRYQIILIINPDNSYLMTVGHQHTLESPTVPGTGYHFDYSHLVTCQGETSTINNRQPDDDPFYGPVPPFIQKVGTPNQIAGTYVVDLSTEDPPGSATFRWDFQRRTIPPP